MKSPFDQNPEQEAEQQYERNLARNYPADERAGIRASDQRAAYQAATLKLNAEKEAQNIRDNSIRLGIAQAVEARAIKADELAATKNAAQNAFDEHDLEKEQGAAGQVPAMLAEIKKRRNPNGYVSFQDLNEIDIMFPLASLSKNPRIAKMKDQERELTTSIMGKQAESRENIAKEERARNKETEERMIAEVAAQEAGAVPTKFIIGGKTFETSTKSDAASLEKETKAEMASLEKERKISVDQFAKARNARTRAGVVLATALKTKNEKAINAANDLIKAADEDVIEMRAKRDEAESALRVRVSNKAPAEGKQPQFTIGNPNGMPTPAASAATTEAKQFASEAEARKSGAKAGDIIILINPKTGKPGRARLD